MLLLLSLDNSHKSHQQLKDKNRDRQSDKEVQYNRGSGGVFLLQSVSCPLNKMDGKMYLYKSIIIIINMGDLNVHIQRIYQKGIN